MARSIIDELEQLQALTGQAGCQAAHPRDSQPTSKRFDRHTNASELGLEDVAPDEYARGGLRGAQRSAPDEGELVDVGRDAMWSVSSYKRENPITLLRDGSLETFWQSEGNVPHAITAIFPRKRTLYDLRFYVDYSKDESYTPVRVEVNVGPSEYDLDSLMERDLMAIHQNGPQGWIALPFVGTALDSPGGDTSPSNSEMLPAFTLRVDRFECIRTRVVQLVILENSAHGRDSHIRQIEVRAPKCVKSRAKSTDPFFCNPLSADPFALPAIPTDPFTGLPRDLFGLVSTGPTMPFDVEGPSTRPQNQLEHPPCPKRQLFSDWDSDQSTSPGQPISPTFSFQHIPPKHYPAQLAHSGQPVPHFPATSPGVHPGTIRADAHTRGGLDAHARGGADAHTRGGLDGQDRGGVVAHARGGLSFARDPVLASLGLLEEANEGVDGGPIVRSTASLLEAMCSEGAHGGGLSVRGTEVREPPNVDPLDSLFPWLPDIR